MKKSSELSTAARLAAPVVTLVAGIGGFALEVCFGKTVSEGITSGVLTAAICGTAAYVLPRFEEEPDTTAHSS